MKKNQTIGDILREYKTRSRAPVIDITELCDYAKLLREPLPTINNEGAKIC